MSMDKKEYHRQYYIKNKEKCSARNRRSAAEWKEKQMQLDPEYLRNYKRKWDRSRRKDPIFRIGENMRGNMHHALAAKKAGRKWEDLVGYSLQDLINHLTLLLGNGMTWENYGEVWHIDHITPKSWFKYESTDDPKFRECWALSNLQPKLKLDNIRKGNRFSG